MNGISNKSNITLVSFGDNKKISDIPLHIATNYNGVITSDERSGIFKLKINSKNESYIYVNTGYQIGLYLNRFEWESKFISNIFIDKTAIFGIEEFVSFDKVLKAEHLELEFKNKDTNFIRELINNKKIKMLNSKKEAIIIKDAVPFLLSVKVILNGTELEKLKEVITTSDDYKENDTVIMNNIRRLL